MIATGGTKIVVGLYVVHVFLASGTLVVSEAGDVEALLVAGGGGGGDGQDRTAGGGGGGGVLALPKKTLAVGSYPVVVGPGGVGGVSSGAPAQTGGNSSFNGDNASGGGHGNGFTSGNAAPGGSGGGARHGADAAGTGIAGQGFKGGDTGNAVGGGSGKFAGCGGGGAAAPGGNAVVTGGGTWVASQVKTFARPGGPSATARKDWRIRITAWVGGSFFPSLSEIEFRATVGGPGQTPWNGPGGSFSSSSNYSTETPDKAFDTNPGTWWSAGGDSPQWIAAHVATAIVVNEVMLKARSDTNQGPAEFYVESSNDGGGSWDPEWSVLVGVTPGAGGAGVPSSIDGIARTYAGGGGGSMASYDGGAAVGGPGGAGGGGAGGGAAGVIAHGADAAPNTGGGGGGGGYAGSHGGAGGSGIVIVRYPAPEPVDGVYLRHTYAGPDNAATVGTAQTGQVPTVEPGATVGILDNAAYGVAGNGSYFYDVGRSDGTIRFTIHKDTGAAPFLLFRAVDIDNMWGLLLAGAAAAFYQKAAGAISGPYASVAYTPVQGDLLELQMHGPDLTFFVNGASVLTLTSAFQQTATRLGFQLTPGGGTVRNLEFGVSSAPPGSGSGGARVALKMGLGL